MMRRFSTSLSNDVLKEVYEGKRRRFFQLEHMRESVVDWSRLSEDEVAIHKAHQQAVHNLHFSYDDPVTGEKVFTRYYRALAGSCCRQACRHCTYNFDEVPEALAKEKTFNTSFWIHRPFFKEHEQNKIKNLITLIRVKPKKNVSTE